jgi:hypothetical protein
MFVLIIFEQVILKMQSWKRAFIYGIIAWIVPFIAAFAIYGLHESNRPLFESIMAVVIAGTTALLAASYLKRVRRSILSESVMLGVLWMLLSIAIDLPLFSYGPMAESMAAYVSDIAVTYLMMPAIAAGMGYMRA